MTPIINVRWNNRSDNTSLIFSGYADRVARRFHMNQTTLDHFLTKLLQNGFVKFGPYVFTFTKA